MPTPTAPANYCVQGRRRGVGARAQDTQAVTVFALGNIRPRSVFNTFAGLQRWLPWLLPSPPATRPAVYVEDVARCFSATRRPRHIGKAYDLCGAARLYPARAREIPVIATATRGRHPAIRPSSFLSAWAMNGSRQEAHVRELQFDKWKRFERCLRFSIQPTLFGRSRPSTSAAFSASLQLVRYKAAARLP